MLSLCRRQRRRRRPAAQKAVGAGDGGKKFMAVMLKQACDRRPSQLQKGARQLIETWQRTYASNPGLPYFATVAVELAAFKHQNGEAPSAAPTDALQFAGGPQLQRRGAASGMDDSASLSAASLQRHREAAEAAQIRQAIADQHSTLDEAPTSTSQEEAMLARAMEESRQSASASAPDAFAPVAPPAADPFASPPSPTLPPRPPVPTRSRRRRRRRPTGAADRFAAPPPAAPPAADPSLPARARRAAADPFAASGAAGAARGPTRLRRRRQRPQAQRILRGTHAAGRRRCLGAAKPAADAFGDGSSPLRPRRPSPGAAAARSRGRATGRPVRRHGRGDAGRVVRWDVAHATCCAAADARRLGDAAPRDDDAATVGDDAARHRLRGAGPAATRRLGGDDGAASRRDDASRRLGCDDDAPATGRAAGCRSG